MIVRHLFILFLACISVFQVKSQTVLTTPSGHKIVVLSNGSWENADILHSDSSEMLMVNLNPLVKPTGQDDITDDEVQTQKLIIDHITNLESQKEVDIFQNREDLRMLELKMSVSKMKKDKEKQIEITTEIDKSDELFKQWRNEQKLYTKDIKTTKEILSENKKHRVDLLREMSYKYSLKTPVLDYNVYGDEPNKAVNVALESPKVQKTSDCLIERDIVSESKSRLIEMQFENLFSYTPEKLKGIIKNKDYTNGSARIMKDGKKWYLDLIVKFESKDASKSYGVIPQGSLIQFSFLKGPKLFAFSANVAKSEIEPYSGNTVYRVKYELDDVLVKSLKNDLLDSVGLDWSAGFETYIIYNIDLVKNQIHCIDSLH